VVRALEAEGLHPAGIVGVSMGAVVGAAYAHRLAWYEAVLGMDVTSFPGPVGSQGTASSGPFASVRQVVSYLRALKTMVIGWGPGTEAHSAGLAELRRLFGDRALESGRIPVVVSATDLRTGKRVVLGSGPAVDAVYASAALAGVLPPLHRKAMLLADGAYTDLAPVDVARDLVPGAVVAVDPGQDADAGEIRNGFQAIMRAVEICHRQHADLRFEQADLVLRPRFRRRIDVLDFGARRECIAEGIRAVRSERRAIRELLGSEGRNGPVR
jgi:NTE family protein